MCDLTNYLVAIPIQDKSTNSIAEAIMEGFILAYGPMNKILSDISTEYINLILFELCAMINIEKHVTKNYTYTKSLSKNQTPT